MSYQDTYLSLHHICHHKSSCPSDFSSRQSFPCSDSAHCLKCYAAMNCGSNSFILILMIIFCGRLSMSRGAVSCLQLLMLNLDGIVNFLRVTPALGAISPVLFTSHVLSIFIFTFIFISLFISPSHHVFSFPLLKPLAFPFLSS
jgi:hypothetical protein